MSANPELVIPPALSADAALQQPHQFGGQDQQRDQIPEAGKEIAPVTHSTKDLGDKLTELVNAENSLQGIQSLASMVSDRFGSTTDYLKQATSEFSTLREAIRQVAKVTDWPNSTPFTLQQTSEAARGGLTLAGGVDLREKSAARAGARLEVNQQRLNLQQSGQFPQAIAEFTRARDMSKPEAVPIESELRQLLSVPQDVSRQVDPYVEVQKTLQGAAPPGSQILPQINRLMSQAVFPEEAKKPLPRMSKAIPSEKGPSISEVTKARTSTQMTGREEAASLNQGLTPRQSIERAPLRLQDGVTNGDDFDAMLKELASSIRDVQGLRGFVDRSVNGGTFERVSDFALKTPADPLQQAIEDYQNSQAGEQTRLIVGEPPPRTEWVEVNANLEHLRQLAKLKLGHEGRFELPPHSYAEPNTPSAVTEGRVWEPVANERAVAPVWQRSSLLQSRSSIPGATAPMFDYEIRRILERGTRLMEEAAKPGSTRLLASPLPNPRTRM